MIPSIHVGFVCNNRCGFCCQGDLRRTAPARDLSAIVADLESTRSVGGESVVFTGGEPTLFDGLPSWIGAARRLGFGRVGVQTNGRRLAYRDYAAALRDSGVDFVEISVAGATPEAHEYHTKTPGSFSQTRNGARNAKSLGLDVGLTVVLTRSTYRQASDLVHLARGWRVDALHLAAARAMGHAVASLPRVIPRSVAVSSYAVSALAPARRHGLTACISGLAPCVVHAAGGRPGALLATAQPGSFADPCHSCSARPLCTGVDREYLARYGASELRPVASDAVRGIAALTHHTSPQLFAGLGRLNA